MHTTLSERSRLHRVARLASDPGPLVLRVIALLPWAWVGLLYGLFAITALRFGEWPHRPGDHRFSACQKTPSAFAISEDWCAGTFDPKGYGLALAVLLVLTPFVVFSALSWIPVRQFVKRDTGRSRARWDVIFVLGLAAVVLTGTVDPLGAMAWFLD